MNENAGAVQTMQDTAQEGTPLDGILPEGTPSKGTPSEGAPSKGAPLEGTPWYKKVMMAAGTVGDSIPYYLFYTYFLYFLTTVVGITPAVAGIISSVAIVWNAVACPIVGYLSDNSKNPRGRRRPLIRKGFIGEIVFLVLLFAPVPFTGAVRTAYYVVVAILLWTCYTCVLIPWQSLGGDLFRDYNERNTLLMWVSILSLPLAALCNSGPMWIQAWLLPKGVSESACWLITAVCGVVIIAIGAAICLRASRGTELTGEAAVKQREEQLQSDGHTAGLLDFFKTCLDLLKMKQYRIIIFVGLFFLTAYTLTEAVLVYVMTYNAGMSEVQMGTFWVVFSVIAVAGAPICTGLANKTNKKTSFLIFDSAAVVVCVVYFILGIHNAIGAYLFGGLFALASAAFWSIFYSMIYDSIEVYEFKHGVRNEGSVVSLAAFIQTCGGGVASLIAGFALEFIGYSSDAVVTESMEHGLLSLTTIVPAVLIVVAILLLSRYKINRTRFEALKAALEKKRNGEAYTTEGFEDIL